MPIPPELTLLIPRPDVAALAGATMALAAIMVGLAGAVGQRARASRLHSVTVDRPLREHGRRFVEGRRVCVRVRCKLVANVLIYHEDGAVETLLEDAAEEDARSLFESLTGRPWTATLATDGPWAGRAPERGRVGATVPFGRAPQSARAA
jgi:hypothetical protein